MTWNYDVTWPRWSLFSNRKQGRAQSHQFEVVGWNNPSYPLIMQSIGAITPSITRPTLYINAFLKSSILHCFLLMLPNFETVVNFQLTSTGVTLKLQTTSFKTFWAINWMIPDIPNPYEWELVGNNHFPSTHLRNCCTLGPFSNRDVFLKL